MERFEARLQVACFGNFRIAGADGWVPGPPSRRARELIQYLVLYPNRSVQRERLSESFWPDLDLESVLHRLHIAVSGARAFLREVLGGFDAIQCSQDGYSWHPGVRVDSDLVHFTELYRGGTLDAFKAAAALYAGDLFEGQESDWLQGARVKYATMHASILERLAAAALAEREFDAALNYGLELLGVDRAHEGASRLVMRCFGAMGRRGRALAEYEALRLYLRKHLSLEPTVETRDVIRSVMGEGVNVS